MGTTFDRYLIARYLQIFVILYLSVFGLFVVIDGFSNLDEFQDHAENAVELLMLMGGYYANQSTLFLDMCGPTLTVVDAMVVFALPCATPSCIRSWRPAFPRGGCWCRSRSARPSSMGSCALIRS